MLRTDTHYVGALRSSRELHAISHIELGDQFPFHEVKSAGQEAFIAGWVIVGVAAVLRGSLFSPVPFSQFACVRNVSSLRCTRNDLVGMEMKS